MARITPLADGLNLVCEVFITSNIDRKGAPVLSEFAGTAVELHSAVIANPFSFRSMGSAILPALAMPDEEQRERMKDLREAVLKHTIRAWDEAIEASHGKTRQSRGVV